MTATATEQPAFTGFHHDAPAVRDIDASAAWYERVLGLSRSETPCPEDDAAADRVVLSDPGSGVAIHLQGPGPGGPPSHTAFSVASRSQLDTWAGWLDGLGVRHGGSSPSTTPRPSPTSWSAPRTTSRWCWCTCPSATRCDPGSLRRRGRGDQTTPSAPPLDGELTARGVRDLPPDPFVNPPPSGCRVQYEWRYVTKSWPGRLLFHGCSEVTTPDVTTVTRHPTVPT
jgi:catechol 2,3-dioxygenase-like lactoylglutathione lyase family enzyme